MNTRLALFLAFAASAAPRIPLAQKPATEEWIRPSQTNAEIRQFDEPNLVIGDDSTTQPPPLVVFFPGTHGKPGNAEALLNVVAGQGYRVIGLTYIDEPPGTVLCPRNPNVACFTRFHAMRAFAQGPAPVANTYAESIEGRLVSLLHYLDRAHPAAGWSTYLTEDGHPQWSRIVVSGLSQGAGMAAYIAKTVPVYRVVLFSSPWDNLGPQHRPAHWLFQQSATPPDRWWAERHVQENTTQWIAAAYEALRIPRQHIFLFDRELSEDGAGNSPNPLHGSTIRNPAYVPQWKLMYGNAGAR